MSAAGFVAAVACTLTLFAIFAAEVRYQHRRSVAWRLARMARVMRRVQTTMGDRLVPAFQEAGVAAARLAEAYRTAFPQPAE